MATDVIYGEGRFFAESSFLVGSDIPRWATFFAESAFVGYPTGRSTLPALGPVIVAEAVLQPQVTLLDAQGRFR